MSPLETLAHSEMHRFKNIGILILNAAHWGSPDMRTIENPKLRFVSGFALLAAAIISCLALNAYAGGDSSTSPMFSDYTRVISYNDLMRLSPQNRASYLEGVRRLLIDIEALQQGQGVINEKERKRTNAYRELLRRFSETADAADSDKCGILEGGKLGQHRINLWQYANVSQYHSVCVNDGMQTRQVFKNASTGKWESCPGGKGLFGYGALPACPESKPCADGLVAVGQTQSGNYYCATRSSFDRLAPIVQAAVTKPDPVVQRAFDKANVKNPMLLHASDTVQKLQIVAAAPSETTAPSKAKMSVAADSEGKPKAARAKPKKHAADTEVRNKKPVAQNEDSTPKVVATKTDDTKVDAGYDPIEDCAAKAAAPSQPIACNDSTVAAASKAFHAGSNCLYGGNLQPFSSSLNSSGSRSCQPISAICFEGPYPGRDNCQRADGTSITPAFKCDDNKQIICNPLIFGMNKPQQASGKPTAVCVDRGADATDRCDKATRRCPEGQHVDPNSRECVAANSGIDSQQIDWFGDCAKGGDCSKQSQSINNFISEDDRNFLFGPQANNPAQAAADYWDSFAKSMNKLCIDDAPSRQYLCKECQIIRQRLAKLNILYTKKDGKDVAQTCQRIVAFSDKLATASGAVGAVVQPLDTTTTAPAAAAPASK